MRMLILPWPEMMVTNFAKAVALAFLVFIAMPCTSVADEIWMQAYSYDLPEEQAYYDDLAKAYAAEPGLPSVRITLEKWDHAHAQIADWFAAGKGPDLIVVPDIWLAEFAPHIEPFEPYVTPQMRDEFHEVLYNKGIYKDHLLGLVWATSTKALFYRTDLFEKAGLEPPQTWAEQLGAAVALNDPPNVHGLGLPGAREYETDDNFFFYFWSAGGRFFDESGKCTLNSPAGVQALQFYCDLVNKYHVTQPEVTTWNRKQTRGLLEKGKLAMFAEGPWVIEQMRKNAPGVPFAVVPLPVLKEPVTQIITDHLVMPHYSPRKDETARFVQFAYRDEHRLAFAKKGILPEKKAVGRDPHFQNDPNWRVFVDIIPSGQTIPLMQWEEVGIATREAMYQALTGRQTPKEALDTLAELVDKHVASQK